MTEEMIKMLESKGFKRWQKGDYDRLYINAYALGLHTEKYNSGNIKRSWIETAVDQYEVSHSEANRMLAAKTYIDVKTGKLYCNNDTCRELVKSLISAL